MQNTDIERQRAEKIEFFKAQAQQYNFTREYSKAMMFYVRAGLLGDCDAIRLVCGLLKSGYGMSYNYEEIYRCMRIGAREGIADAMYELGVCYSTGCGVEADTAQAMHWFSEGAKAGSEDAKNSLRAYNYELHIRTEDYPSAYADIVRKSVYGTEALQRENAAGDAASGGENGAAAQSGRTDAQSGRADAQSGRTDVQSDRTGVQSGSRAVDFVMYDGTKPVASVMMYWDRERQTHVIDKFCILPEYRGIGIGEDLIREAVTRVRMEGKQLLAVCTDADIRDLCEQMGFLEERICPEDEDSAKVWLYRRFPPML